MCTTHCRAREEIDIDHAVAAVFGYREPPKIIETVVDGVARRRQVHLRFADQPEIFQITPYSETAEQPAPGTPLAQTNRLKVDVSTPPREARPSKRSAPIRMKHIVETLDRRAGAAADAPALGTKKTVRNQPIVTKRTVVMR